MTISTVKGSRYVVATESVCHITDTATGMPLGSAWANAPYTFTAQGSTTTLSDDSALYTKANFNSAAGALRLPTGGNPSPLPEGYLPASFVQFMGERGNFLSIPATCEVDDSLVFESHMRFTDLTKSSYELSFPMLDHYCGLVWAAGRGKGVCVISSSNIQGEWADTLWHHYRIEHAVAIGGFRIDGKQEAFVEGLQVAAPIDSSLGFGIGGCASSSNSYKCACVAHCDFRFYKNGVLERDFVPCLHPHGYSCFYDLVTKTPFYLTGANMWVGMTLEQARRLPELAAPQVSGDPLLLILPADWPADVGTVAAVDAARAKGWTVDINTVERSLMP